MTMLVFAHGMMMDRRQFEPQVDDLSRDHRVHAYDLRSRDARGERAFDLDDLVEDCERELDSAVTEPAILVGMSLGGSMALRFALRHPERLAGLVLIAAAADPETPAAAAAAERHFEAQRDAPVVDASVARDEAEAHFSTRTRRVQPDLVDRWAERFAGRSGQATWWETCCWTRQDDVRDQLAGLRLPVLVLWGDEDGLVPLRRGLATAAAIPDSRLCVVPYAGHGVNLEAPEHVNAALRAFAAECALAAV